MFVVFQPHIMEVNFCPILRGKRGVRSTNASLMKFQSITGVPFTHLPIREQFNVVGPPSGLFLGGGRKPRELGGHVQTLGGPMFELHTDYNPSSGSN